MRRLETWCQWHEHWVYGRTPRLALPQAMPLDSATSTGEISFAKANQYGYMEELFNEDFVDEGEIEPLPIGQKAESDAGSQSKTSDFPFSDSETSSYSSRTAPLAED